MANNNKIKMKKVTYTNMLLPGHPTQHKLAMVTPTVVSRGKFIQNVSDHTGLNKHIVRSVIDSIEECAGDYMEIGNAVQIGDDFGTLKPTVKVKAVNSLEECTADTVLSIGMKFIPTGNMRTRLSQVGFVVKGTSDGSDVEDSEVETENPSGEDETPETPTLYTLTFKHNDAVVETQQYAEGATVTPPTAPTGYAWTDCPNTMPARDLVVTTVAEGGDSGEI